MIFRNYLTRLYIKYPFLPDYNFSYTISVKLRMLIPRLVWKGHQNKQHNADTRGLGRYFVKHGHAIKRSTKVLSVLRDCLFQVHAHGPIWEVQAGARRRGRGLNAIAEGKDCEDANTHCIAKENSDIARNGRTKVKCNWASSNSIAYTLWTIGFL